MIRPVIGAHVPWAQIENYLQLILDMDLVPEIAIKGPELDSVDPAIMQAVVQKLSDKSIRPRVHAPFFDLNPGALDPLIRETTLTRLSQALSFAKQLNADLMILHPGVDKWRYPNLEKAWLSNAVDFFPELINQAAAFECRLAIENIYEESPHILVELVNRLDSEWFGHCFDAGHWHLFGRRPLPEWLEAIHSKLFHFHLHDNHGRADEHLPVGEGTIDFEPLKTYLQKTGRCPSITLEAHNIKHLKLSLQRIHNLLE